MPITSKEATPRTRQALAAAVASFVGLVLLAGAAAGHFDTSHYTYGGSSRCRLSDHVDPINLIFYGDHGTFGGSVNQISYHARWDNQSGSRQNFKDHGRCRAMHGQRASAGSTSNRFHVRLRRLADRDSKGRWEAVGDAHHEDFVVTCPGHAVDKGTKRDPTSFGSGFDQGRRRLYLTFRDANVGNHRVQYRYWGNTQVFKQCDGDNAGSNGTVAWINLSHVHAKDGTPIP